MIKEIMLLLPTGFNISDCDDIKNKIIDLTIIYVQTIRFGDLSPNRLYQNWINETIY